MSEDIRDNIKPKNTVVAGDAERVQELVGKFDNGANSDELFALSIGDYDLFKAIKEGNTNLIEAIKEDYRLFKELQARRVKEGLEEAPSDGEMDAECINDLEEDKFWAKRIEEDRTLSEKDIKAIDNKADQERVEHMEYAKLLKAAGIFSEDEFNDQDEFLTDITQQTKIVAHAAYGSLDAQSVKDMGERIAMDNYRKKRESLLLQRMAR